MKEWLQVDTIETFAFDNVTNAHVDDNVVEKDYWDVFAGNWDGLLRRFRWPEKWSK